MEILFRTKKLEKECNSQKLLMQRYGSQRARVIRLRLDDLRAAPTLETVRYLPQARCHELKGNLAGQLSVDLDHPYRLLFRPANDPVPRKPDGGLDWGRITIIEILGVEDTHG
jgi:plasmid maintenance system killer protein